jgi:hypothetical protein
MPALSKTLTDTFQPLVDFSTFRVSYFNIEIENFDGPYLEFTFGHPVSSAVEIRVPNQCSVTRDNRALKGILYGRCQAPGETAAITITIW